MVKSGHRAQVGCDWAPRFSARPRHQKKNEQADLVRLAHSRVCSSAASRQPGKQDEREPIHATNAAEILRAAQLGLRGHGASSRLDRAGWLADWLTRG